jgi:hypothetical protein
MTEWVMVPSEPTEEMLNLLWLELGDHPSREHAKDAWRSALDAAPAAPQQAEPVGDGPLTIADAFACGHSEGINDCLRNGLDWAHEYMGGTPGKRAKSEQHPPAAEVQRLVEAAQAVVNDSSTSRARAGAWAGSWPCPRPRSRPWSGAGQDLGTRRCL